MDRTIHGSARVTHSLEIHSAEALSGCGAVRSLETVFCPGKGHSVSLELCLSCRDFIGIARDERKSVAGLRQDPISSSSVVCRTTGPSGPVSEPAVALSTPVSAAMTRDVICVRDDVSVETLTTLLLEKWIGGVPVVDEHGRPIGIVSKTDLLRESHDHRDLSELRSGDARRASAPREGSEAETPVTVAARATVGEIMTPIAMTLPEAMPLSHACALMVLERVHRLPVVDREGRVVGIFTTTDGTRWLADHASIAEHALPRASVDPGEDSEVTPISIRPFAMNILWVCGRCGEHYPHARGCPEQCDSCGALKQFFYSPTED